MNYPQNHKKKKKIRVSYLWAGVMSVCALAALFAAVWVVITVYEKIAGDSREWAKADPTAETTVLEIETEEIFGWITDESGSRYREEDGSFAANAWKIWDNKLYYLKEDGYMACEEVKTGGQIFSFREDGALEDIRQDRTWEGLTGDDNLQNLNSLVKSNEFWCYLSSDPVYTGSFKPICYRKTTETREEVLGGANPEFSTKNSMQIHNGYIYFLPQVTAEQKAVLPAQQQALCNKLFRMKPGNTQKELLAENATGYLVLEDGSVYYASGGEIFPVNEGSVSFVGEEHYRVLVRDNGVYLVDSAGNVISGEESGVQMIEDRVYTLESGRITKVSPGEQRLNNAVFTLEPDPQDRGKNAIFKQEDAGSKSVFAQAPFGIDSFCIAEGKIYCSAFVTKGEDNTRFSQIYRISPDGSEYEALNGQFEGNIIHLYYYKDKGKIYGEYTPKSWIGCYGQIAVLDLDGNMNVIDDSATRGNADTGSNELATLLMVDGNTVTVYLQTCEYSVSAGGWNVLSERPFQFEDTRQRPVSAGISGLEGSTENGEEPEEGEPGEGGQEDPENGQNERETQNSMNNNRNERETQSSTNNNQNERETQGSTNNNRNERETQSSTNNNRDEHENQGSQNNNRTETTAPQVSAPPTEAETAPPQTSIPRPADPGSTAPPQTWPEPGNTIPTVEANPQQNIPAQTAPASGDVQYIGPGGPLG